MPESLEEEEQFYQGPIVDRVDLHIARTLEEEEVMISSRSVDLIGFHQVEKEEEEAASELSVSLLAPLGVAPTSYRPYKCTGADPI